MLNQALAALLLTCTTLCSAAWTPPADRDTIKVLTDAMLDRSAGRHSDALEKIQWFYANANDAERPIRRTTQLPFAFAVWAPLAKAYPPARTFMVETRDRAEQRVREGQDPTIWFREVTAFNKELEESARSIVLFKWLHENKPANAKVAFAYIYEEVFVAKEYKLLGQIIDTDTWFDNHLQRYREVRGFDEPKEKTDAFVDAKQHFERRSAMLVALLVINGKPKDAERIAKRARAEVPDKAFGATLDAALKGTMPVKDPNCDPKRRRC